MGIINVSLSIKAKTYADSNYQGNFEIVVHGADMEIARHLKRFFPTMKIEQTSVLGCAESVDDLGIITVTMEGSKPAVDMQSHALGLATSVLNSLEMMRFKLISTSATVLKDSYNVLDRHTWALQSEKR